MYHPRAQDYHAKYQFSTGSGWQTPQTDDDYFQRRAHDDHTNNYKYLQQSSGWQTSPANDDYFQISRAETTTTVRTVEAPLFPNLNTIINETVIREANGPRRDEYNIAPKARGHVHVKKHVHYEQADKEGKKRETYDENIDAEADDFIKQKHKKFELSKLLSMKAI
ncbi:hypothetical protein BVC80_887g108 [Macleaya cordata]|uniref:Uncharacterized protein n=1 Tax=Macleaya cordata TaxID=56857 RepID=A0A200RDM1_MACCD|nr:hypothetical protein BVC80_887g108 [Macleaya cordata]